MKDEEEEKSDTETNYVSEEDYEIDEIESCISSEEEDDSDDDDMDIGINFDNVNSNTSLRSENFL